jgi:G3E family GTPase
LKHRIPVTILAGFLGAGKTTLLRQALSGGAGKGVAVIINEFGEIGLDHELLIGAPETTSLVSGGCACCSRKDELAAAIRRLLDHRQESDGLVLVLDRLVIECSGMADPAPIVFTIMTDPVLQHHFVVDRIVVTIDALNGLSQLERHPVARRQVMQADLFAITKSDLAGPHVVRSVRRRLHELNPAARFVRSRRELLPSPAAGGSPSHRSPSQPSPPHQSGPSSLALALDEPLDWVAFGVWLTMLLHAHGERVLRVKGIIETGPLGAVSVNTVGHVVYPPEHLGRPAEDASPRLVFIVEDLDPALIERSFRAFQRVA